jgi:hypothetical protein
MFFDKFIRRFISQRIMRSNFVVSYPPIFDDFLGVFKIRKPMFIETFIPKLSVKTLDKSVIRRLSGLNVFDMNPSLFGPLLKVLSCKFRSVVHANVAGITLNHCLLI